MQSGRIKTGSIWSDKGVDLRVNFDLVKNLFVPLGQIDTTFGLASGTAGAALVSAIHMRMLWLYQRPTTTNLP